MRPWVYCQTLKQLENIQYMVYDWGKPLESGCKIREFTAPMSLEIEYTNHLIKYTLELCS